MAHSYWIILAFLPPVLIFSVLIGYDRWVLGIKLPAERKALKDYSAAEIVYAFFVAFIIIANFLGGMVLLNRFEPVTPYLVYIYFIILSLPLTGVALGHYAEMRHEKGVGFQTLIFTLFLFPTLITLCGFAYNGFADEMPAQKIQVTVIEKRIQINKGGGTPLIKFQPVGKAKAILHSPREIEVSKALYKTIRVGDEIRLTIKPGALGIPWLEKVAPQ